MKTFKKIVTLLLVVCMTVSLLTLVSCKKDNTNDNSDNNNG